MSFFVESLITPELWLKNCRSRSPTPERYEPKSPSKSPSPITSFMSVEMNEKMMKSLPQPSVSSLVSPAKITGVTNLVHGIAGSKKPLINVLPSSKLLSRNLLHHKSLRKRRMSTRLTQSTKINQVRSNRLMDSNFPPDLQGNIHTQVSNNAKAQSTAFNAHPMPPNQSVPSQFSQRPPINLFKLRMPFVPPSLHPQQQRMPIFQQQHQQPPEDGSNLNLLPPPNPLLPPPVVLVPYAIPLPIIIPIPLPLTAFLKAYQTKGYNEISSNDNDSHEETRTAASVGSGVRINENEQLTALDLSSEQGVSCETDKNFISHNKNHNNHNNNEGELTSDSEVRHSVLGGKNIPEHEVLADVKKMQPHAIVKDDVSSENNRPLRKRKIIATSEELNKSQ